MTEESGAEIGMFHPMMVDFAFLATRVEVDTMLLNAWGIGFDTVTAPGVPVGITFSAVVQFRASRTEVGDVPVAISLVADGRQSIVADIRRLIHMEPHGLLLERCYPNVFTFEHVELPVFGRYWIVVTVRNHELARLPLDVAPGPHASTITR